MNNNYYIPFEDLGEKREYNRRYVSGGKRDSYRALDHDVTIEVIHSIYSLAHNHTKVWQAARADEDVIVW